MQTCARKHRGVDARQLERGSKPGEDAGQLECENTPSVDTGVFKCDINTPSGVDAGLLEHGINTPGGVDTGQLECDDKPVSGDRVPSNSTVPYDPHHMAGGLI